jgi:hypothetical protein
MWINDEDEYAATVAVARTASGTGRFVAVLEVAPTIFEFIRPNGVVYRLSVVRVLSTVPTAVNYGVVVDATSSPAKRWRRTEYSGQGRSPSAALQNAISTIEVDQTPFGDD